MDNKPKFIPWSVESSLSTEKKKKSIQHNTTYKYRSVTTNITNAHSRSLPPNSNDTGKATRNKKKKCIPNLFNATRLDSERKTFTAASLPMKANKQHERARNNFALLKEDKIFMPANKLLGRGNECVKSTCPLLSSANEGPLRRASIALSMSDVSVKLTVQEYANLGNILETTVAYMQLREGQPKSHQRKSASVATGLRTSLRSYTTPGIAGGILPIMPFVPGYHCFVPGYPWSVPGYPGSVPACPQSLPGCP